MKRAVSLSTFIDLLKEKKRFFFMGGIFSLIALFVFLPMVIFITSTMKEPYQEYNENDILKKGTTAKATVNQISEITNVTVNGLHPVEITYVYQSNGHKVKDKFQTLDLDKISLLQEGNIVNVKYYNNESILTDFDSYSFPIGFIYFAPLMFLIPGLIIFSLALFPALKKRKLYKTGVITDAHFIGISIFSTTPFMNDRMANVDYYFIKNGHKIFGTSITKDFLPLSLKAKEDIIKIFVNPDDDSQSCYIPKKIAQKNNWNINFD